MPGVARGILKNRILLKKDFFGLSSRVANSHEYHQKVSPNIHTNIQIYILVAKSFIIQIITFIDDDE